MNRPLESLDTQVMGWLGTSDYFVIAFYLLLMLVALSAGLFMIVRLRGSSNAVLAESIATLWGAVPFSIFPPVGMFLILRAFYVAALK